MIHMPGTGITPAVKLTLLVKRNPMIMVSMIFLEMFGNGLQTGTRKIIIRSDHRTTQKAHLMGNTGCFEVDHLWISLRDFELPAVTGIYLGLDSKILDFAVQEIKV